MRMITIFGAAEKSRSVAFHPARERCYCVRTIWFSVASVQESAGKSPVDTQAIILKHLVKNIPAWADDTESGGDVAQIISDAKEKNWRWFHRPDFCPEN